MTIEPAAQHKTNLQDYFDGIGFDRWAAIYGGDEDLSYVRRNVQQGHDRMLMVAGDWLSEGITQGTLLDAGCGTGLFSIAMAHRGFTVTGVDIAPRMVTLAASCAQDADVDHRTTFLQGDIAGVDGSFSAVACFDVLVHYPHEMFVDLCRSLARKAEDTLLLTYAPYNRLLAFLHWVGGRFPQGNRRTEIQMIPDALVAQTLSSEGFSVKRSTTISQGFYHVKLVEATRL